MRLLIVGITLLLLLFPLIAPTPSVAQSGEGLGISPPRITITDAQPGERYLRTVSVQNQFDSPSTMSVESEGEAGTWTLTNPGSGFVIPARSAKEVTLDIQVPAGVGPGTREGLVRFVTEAKGAPTGSGAGVRFAVATLLNITTGGEPRIALVWLSAAARDADTATAPVATAQARNDGNVRATARIRATALTFDARDEVAQAEGELSLRPGETGTVNITLPAPLPFGQYRMAFAGIEPSGFTFEDEFKVGNPGEIVPRAKLLALKHPAYLASGAVARIDGLLRNDGNVTIRSAVLTLEIFEAGTGTDELAFDGRLLAVVKSDPLVVPPGATVEMPVYWTPPNAGTFHLRGQVNYDGYQTVANGSILNAQGGPASGGIPWLLILIVLAIVAVAASGVWYWRRSGRKEAERPSRASLPAPGKKPPPGPKPPEPGAKPPPPSRKPPTPPGPPSPKK